MNIYAISLHPTLLTLPPYGLAGKDPTARSEETLMYFSDSLNDINYRMSRYYERAQYLKLEWVKCFKFAIPYNKKFKKALESTQSEAPPRRTRAIYFRRVNRLLNEIKIKINIDEQNCCKYTCLEPQKHFPSQLSPDVISWWERLAGIAYSYSRKTETTNCKCPDSIHGAWILRDNDSIPQIFPLLQECPPSLQSDINIPAHLIELDKDWQWEHLIRQYLWGNMTQSQDGHLQDLPFYGGPNNLPADAKEPRPYFWFLSRGELATRRKPPEREIGAWYRFCRCLGGSMGKE